MKRLECSPGDIVSEMIGNVEASRYIIVAKGTSVDYRNIECVIYKGYIIYVCEEWKDLHKVGTVWLMSNEQLEVGGLRLKVIFKSRLSWEEFETEKEF